MTAKILIVEDNPMNMKLIAMLLKARGYAPLFQAGSGEQALDIAVRELPDLIIMDVRLPRMDGVDVVKKLRQMPSFDRVPIIALTAYAMKGDKERFLGAGFDAYLSKPVGINNLSATVDRMLSSYCERKTRLQRSNND